MEVREPDMVLYMGLFLYLRYWVRGKRSNMKRNAMKFYLQPIFKYIYSYTTTDLASQIYNYHFFAESFAFLVKILFAGTPLKRFLG